MNPNEITPKRIYSWIPNLSSKINFDYLTNEIVYDDDSQSIRIFELSNDEKEFKMPPRSSSDNLDDAKKGLLYACEGTLKKNRHTGDIEGTYREYYPKDQREINNIPDNKAEIVSVKFKISENGFIEIYDFIWNYSEEHFQEVSLEDKELFENGYRNRQLGIYNNIKNVLHKDVHHNTKEDVSIKVYEDKNTYKEKILQQLVMSIKSLERKIKDDGAIRYKLNLFHKKLKQAEGYKAYLETYCIILCDEAYTLRQEASNLTHDGTKSEEARKKTLEAMDIEQKTKRAISLSKNIIDSATSLVLEEEKELASKEKPFLLILAILTLFLPTLIASLNLLEDTVCLPFNTVMTAIYAALIYTMITIFVGYSYTIQTIAMESYYLYADKNKQSFMRMKNKMVLGESKIIKALPYISLTLVLSSILVILYAIIYL